jgi:Ran GTPase-activating protein (RanGAP) involved in mRNA processing and transport
MENQAQPERRGLSNTITVKELNGAVAELPGERTSTADERLERYVSAQGAQLTDLDLSGTRISERGIASLSKAPHLARLLLNQADVGDSSLKTLGQLSLPGFHELNLEGTRVSDAGVAQLKNLPLTVLNLSDTATTDGCMPYLQNMHSLQVLDANYTGIGDQGVKSLADMPNLRSISLKGCPITDDSVKDLARCPSLMLIDLRDTSLSAESVEWLQAHMPRCVIMVPDGQLSAQALRTVQSVQPLQSVHRRELFPSR